MSASSAPGLVSRDRCIQCVIGKGCGALHIGDFRRALHEAEAADEVGGIDDLTEGGKLGIEQARDASGHAVRIVFDADARAEQIHVERAGS